MHGIFNRGLQYFVCDIYGLDVWEKTCSRAEIQFCNFETMLQYEDGVTDRVIQALSGILSRARAELLEDFGTYAVSEERLATVRRLLRFGGDTYEEFLYSLEDVHDRVKMALPDLELPHLRLFPQTDSSFMLEYRFKKHGYGSVFLGLLRGMADDFGALVVISHDPYPSDDLDLEKFEIMLMSTQWKETDSLQAMGAG